jgi:hypothetical protein
MIKALVEPHVDNTNNDFAVEKSADNFKDYIQSCFSGTVAAGIAYLTMIGDGYTWSDHFESFSGAGNTSATQKPDFVFAKSGKGLLVIWLRNSAVRVVSVNRSNGCRKSATNSPPLRCSSKLRNCSREDPSNLFHFLERH